jgi:hypothetical protein
MVQALADPRQALGRASEPPSSRGQMSAVPGRLDAGTEDQFQNAGS